MNSYQFFDFKHMKTNIRNLDFDTDGLKIRWREIRRIVFNNDESDCMAIKYDYDGQAHSVWLRPQLRRRSQLPILYPLFGDANKPKLSTDK